MIVTSLGRTLQLVTLSQLWYNLFELHSEFYWHSKSLQDICLSFWPKTASMAKSEASHMISKDSDQSGGWMIGTLVTASFKNS